MNLIFLLLALLQATPPKGSIEGVVMKSSTIVQQLLPNARLELTDGPGTPLIVRTDAGGRFAFPSLDPGRYRLSVTRDGFIREKSAAIVLKAGQRIQDIVFRLDPAPTVSGWVQDETGEPLTGVIVQALRRTYDVRGRPALAVVASGMTDDRGAYRIYWLDPGEYFFFVGSVDQTAVVPTYYPGVTDPASATSWRVRIGRDVEGLSFRLRRTCFTLVKGSAVDASTRKPLTARIGLMPSFEGIGINHYQTQSSAAGGSRDAGVFSFDNSKPIVPPGDYVVWGRTTTGDTLVAVERITIKPPCPPPPLPPPPAYDLHTLMFSPPIQVLGRLVADSSTAIDLRRVRLNFLSLDSAEMSPPLIAPQSNGQFVVRDVTPGTYLVSVSDLPETVYVKTLVYGTADVADSSLKLTKESPPAPLQIFLGSDGGRLDIGVYNDQNRPFADATVVLVPDVARRTRPDQYRIATANEEGHASITGIPPGNYTVFAWESVEMNAYLNKEFLQTYEPGGIPVRVAASSNGTMAVRLIPSER